MYVGTVHHILTIVSVAPDPSEMSDVEFWTTLTQSPSLIFMTVAACDGPLRLNVQSDTTMSPTWILSSTSPLIASTVRCTLIWYAPLEVQRNVPLFILVAQQWLSSLTLTNGRRTWPRSITDPLMVAENRVMSWVVVVVCCLVLSATPVMSCTVFSILVTSISPMTHWLRRRLILMFRCCDNSWSYSRNIIMVTFISPFPGPSFCNHLFTSTVMYNVGFLVKSSSTERRWLLPLHASYILLW